MSPTPLELLLSGRFQELLTWMRDPGVRSDLLAEVAGSLGPLPGVPGGAAAVLAERQLSMLASGDWSWGILTPRQRREFLVCDARLLRGAGIADSGAAQAAALKRLRGELGNLYESLNLALAEGDLGWLLPLAEHLASILEFTSDFASMQERYHALLEAARRLRSERLELHARLGLSLALTSLGRYSDAQAEAAAAAALAARLREDSLRGAALHLDGTAKAMAGGYGDARARLGQALSLRRELGERHGVVATMSNLAYVEQCLGQSAAARALLEEALALCRALGDRQGEGKFLQNIGSIEYSAGNYSAARDLGRQALEIFRALGDRRGVANTLGAVGFAEYGAGNFAAAAELHRQALAACRETGDRNGESLSRLALGNLASLAGDAAEAAGHYALALRLCQECGDQQGEARARCGLGQLEQQAGAYAAAAQQYGAALEAFSAMGEPGGVVDCVAYAAALLAGQPAAARDQRVAAAEALRAAEAAALALRHSFDPLDQRIIAAAWRQLEQAVAAGGLGAAALRGAKEAVPARSLSEVAAELARRLRGIR